MSGGSLPSNLSNGNMIGSRPSYLISNDPMTEKELHEVSENINYVHTLIGRYKLIREVYVFPAEILESEEYLYALFQIWIDQNGRSYPSRREQLRRFEGFKRCVTEVSEDNAELGRPDFCVNEYADTLETDKFYCSHLTEEEAEKYMRDYDPDESSPREG